MPALLNQGLTDIRDAISSRVTHVGVATDQTAFAATQTALDPANAGAANLLIKAATDANVDFQTFDATISIDGTTEFTGKTIWTIGILDGSTRTDAMSRTVRSQGIGVQAGDTFTIGVRVKVEDNTA
jgi:hypothetical protein